MADPRRLGRLALGLIALLTASCRAQPHGELQLLLGDRAGERPVQFPLRSAFAEYVSLPELRHELRLTLASYETSCEDYRLPDEGQYAVTITVATPPDQPPTPGQFDWAGHAAHGGTAERPERPYAVPVARAGKRAHEFRPGGSVELKEVGISEASAVRGLLAFEFAGDADHPAQSIKGRFVARMCRSQLPTGGG